MAGHQVRQPEPRCTLCPAGCLLQLGPAGPDAWRIEYPLSESVGLCPRGSTFGELLNHHLRIKSSLRRDGGEVKSFALNEALQDIIKQAADGQIAILLDGNLPYEQLVESAAWCKAWPQAKLSLVIEPTDAELLRGAEASGAEYLSSGDLAECDGFVIIGDAFSSNPVCSRALFDRRRAEPQTPVVVIDPAFGTSAKFANYTVEVEPGTEYAALCVVCESAGVSVDSSGQPTGKEMPSAMAAGQAIAGCKKLAVLIAAEYGRAAPWRQIGYLAGKLADSKGGGVAPQTVGANALAALRLAEASESITLADALSDSYELKVAINCDPIGMLGWAYGRSDCSIYAAAAALPNCTTGQATVILPAALSCELGGTVFVNATEPVAASPLLNPPAGVPSPAELVAALASQAGTAKPELPAKTGLPKRLASGKPNEVAAWSDPPAPMLLLGRQAYNHGCGTMTAHGSWQRGMTETAEIRISADCAEALGLANLSTVKIGAGKSLISGRVRISPELPGSAVVLPEGIPQTRSLMPSKIDPETGCIVSQPVSFQTEWLR